MERKKKKEREKIWERNAMTCTKAQGFLVRPKGPVLQMMEYHSGRECICGHYYFYTDFLVERKIQSIYLSVPITRDSFKSVYVFLPCSHSSVQVSFLFGCLVFYFSGKATPSPPVNSSALCFLTARFVCSTQVAIWHPFWRFLMVAT